MQIKRCCVGVIILLCFFQIFSQSSNNINPFSGQYFRSPVDYSFNQSGNFCELRETHFHAGIDIKPSTSHGEVFLHAIGSGYISRVKISAGGYGKAIYIDHPESGFTSVYAHLDEFNDRIEQLVSQYQMALESYEVDILLNPNVLSIEKSELIGTMGNTGYSFGKHLHFEIRDTKSENPINPSHFGIKSEDHIAPSLVSLAIHGLDPDLYKIWEKRISLGLASDNNINLSTPIEVPAWRAGVALNMYDRSDNSHNKQGIYGFHMYIDDSLAYSYHLDKISFEQAKYIIGYYDYKVKKVEKSTYSLCYRYPGNDLVFIDHTDNGIIPVYVGRERKVRIEIEDFNRNKKSLTFSLIRSQNMVEQSPIDTSLMKILVGDSLTITDKNLTLFFEPKSLFRNIRLNMVKIEGNKNETKYIIHNIYEPIKKPIKISLRPEYPISDKMDKAIIVRTNGSGGSKLNYGGKWIDGYLTTEMTEFGTFFIDYDTIAPTIKSINFTPNVGKKSEIKFHIKDNLPTKGKTVGDIKIKVWIDENFVISPYTSKTQVLQIPVKHLENGGHDLKIEVKDHSGNTAYFSAGFVVKK
ncbi:MAG: M23 family metallopeptidase [Saprospiraceae bacterium]|nr:M23 family metallopeptidase [Saprospiraceae bacterium]